MNNRKLSSFKLIVGTSETLPGPGRGFISSASQMNDRASSVDSVNLSRVETLDVEGILSAFEYTCLGPEFRL